MCGILGVVLFNNDDKVITEEYINSMRDVPSMILRGPDGGGTWISKDEKVSLAHRRLSIIDLSDKANQPMKTHDESIIISFSINVNSGNIIFNEKITFIAK